MGDSTALGRIGAKAIITQDGKLSGWIGGNGELSVIEAIERVTVQTSEGPGRYMMANSLSALVSLVQMGVLEIHIWGSRTPDVEHPDMVVFDLDPDEGVSWRQLVGGARLMRDVLDGLGMRSFVKTTGGKGLHVVVPVSPRRGWDEVKDFSRADWYKPFVGTTVEELGPDSARLRRAQSTSHSAFQLAPQRRAQ